MHGIFTSKGDGESGIKREGQAFPLKSRIVECTGIPTTVNKSKMNGSFIRSYDECKGGH